MDSVFEAASQLLIPQCRGGSTPAGFQEVGVLFEGTWGQGSYADIEGLGIRGVFLGVQSAHVGGFFQYSHYSILGST